MKVVESTILRPGGAGPRIRCSTMDVLSAAPITMAMVFEQTLDPDMLAGALVRALTDCPPFAGSFSSEGKSRFLNCDGRGAQFEVARRDESLEEGVRSLPSTPRRKTVPDVSIGPRKRGFLLHVRVNQFRGGGTILGVSFHHGVGDWQTFMNFLRLWADHASGRPAQAQLIIENRDRYTDEHLHDLHETSGLRLVGYGELAGIAARVLLGKLEQQMVAVHFTEQEAAEIRAHVQTESDLSLSANDALVGHLLATIHGIERRSTARMVSIAVNYRKRTGIAESAVGNFSGLLNVPSEPGEGTVEFARRLRTGLAAWQPRYRTLKHFVESRSDQPAAFRFMPEGMHVDGIALSNFNRFGLSSLSFGDAPMVLFMPIIVTMLPWWGIVSEGYGGRGTQFGINMPRTIARALREPEVQARLHRFRGAEPAPAAGRWPWLV